MSTIAESFQILYDIKENIKNSIEGKGVSVGDAPFTEYSNKIDEIVVDPMDGNYDEGYAEGFSEGYSSGTTDGVNEGYELGLETQKQKLTELNVEENGVYSREDGYNKVTVNIDTDSYYEEGFNSGYESGSESGYNSGYESGYSSGKTDGNSEGYTNGYNAGTVDGYADGKADGENEVKANMQTITITANGAYSDERGYKQVIVNVSDENGDYNDGYSVGYENGYAVGYSSGTTDGYNNGVLSVKSQMKSVTIQQNGVYSDEKGYKEVTVAVDVETPYNNGYTSGYTDGENNIINKATTLNVTENGTYNSDSNIFYNSVVVEVPLYKIVTLTQDEYNAIENKDNETIYLIKNWYVGSR